ncbi:MAG: DUF4369 domain-containing protein [Bacteroidota bacterium]
MRIRKFALLIPVLLFLGACQPPVRNGAAVNGRLADGSGMKMVLQEMGTKEIHAVDSAIIGTDGKFAFNPAVSEPGFWLLKAPSGKILVMAMEAGDQVEVTGSAAGFPDNISLKGPQGAMLLNDFFRSTRKNERRVDSLEALLIDRQDSAGYFELTQSIDSAFHRIWDQQRLLETTYIKNNPGSITSLIVLNYAFGMSPVLSPEEDLACYKSLDSTLGVKYPGNKHVQYHHQRVTEFIRKPPAQK